MPNVLLTQEAGVAVVTIHRPDKLNALNAATIDEIDAAFRDIDANPQVRAVIVTGSGDKAFVAGADIGELARQTPLSGKATSIRGQALLRRIELFRVPVIAAINGFALGGGCELALACHIRLAADNARIGLPEVSLGIIPGYGGTQRLTRLVGRGRAIELTVTGKHITAEEARRIGLVNHVYPQAELMDQARDLCQAILKNGPVAVAAALEVMQHGLDMPLEEAILLEANAFGVVSATEDMKEGLNAFLEKRKPQFKNQ
jgi:enoyl-CoA hydratase